MQGQLLKKKSTSSKRAAKAEIDVLSENLKVALKREQAMVKVGEQKVKMMLAAGQRWEKQQLAKIKKLVAKKT